MPSSLLPSLQVPSLTSSLRNLDVTELRQSFGRSKSERSIKATISNSIMTSPLMGVRKRINNATHTNTPFNHRESATVMSSTEDIAGTKFSCRKNCIDVNDCEDTIELKSSTLSSSSSSFSFPAICQRSKKHNDERRNDWNDIITNAALDCRDDGKILACSSNSADEGTAFSTKATINNNDDMELISVDDSSLLSSRKDINDSMTKDNKLKSRLSQFSTEYRQQQQKQNRIQTKSRRPKFPVTEADVTLTDIYNSSAMDDFLSTSHVARRGHERLKTSVPQVPLRQLRPQYAIGEGSFGSITCVTIAPSDGTGVGHAYLVEGETSPCLRRHASNQSNSSQRRRRSSKMESEIGPAIDEPMNSTCISNLYVVKQLLPSRDTNFLNNFNDKASRKKYIHAITDLITETHFLAGLQHPNIVDIKGIACSDTCVKDYFMVMEHLGETLSQRIHETWSKRHVRSKKISKRLSNIKYSQFLPPIISKKSRSMSSKLWMERIVVARDIVSALQFMHTQHWVMHRDLKPKNIGFDADGTVKLFDFGTAIELPRRSKDQEEDVLCTNMDRPPFICGGIRVGSRRYMAPEVFSRQPYSLPADMYSFTLVLWEMLSFKKPRDWNSGDSKFSGEMKTIEEDDDDDEGDNVHDDASGESFDSEEETFLYEEHPQGHKERTSKKRVLLRKRKSCRDRPSIPSEWSKGIRSLLSLGWSYHPEDRLNADQMLAVLNSELDRLRPAVNT